MYVFLFVHILSLLDACTRIEFDHINHTIDKYFNPFKEKIEDAVNNRRTGLNKDFLLMIKW